MPQMQPPSSGSEYSRRQITLGLVTIFLIYFAMFFFVQTLGIARPRMAADLNGMSLYSWSISIPSLAAAFVTLLFSKLSDNYGRRIMLIICMVPYLAGTILSAISPTFPLLIAANTLARLGSGALAPLCFAVLGDMFPPAERSKWVGLLNIPGGCMALFGPTLGGWFVDNLSWRHLYWAGVPLLILCLVMVPIGVPPVTQKISRKLDIRGTLLVAVASSATILGFSYAGSPYPWASVQIIGLLGIALLFWVLFFWAESHAEEPIMDPQVFRNRTFLTVAVAGLLSNFGLMAIMMYFPIFLQGVQGISVMRSGQILTPYSVLMAFIGVPTGFILARTKRYKWMYIAGYALMAAVITGIMLFNAETPVIWSVVAVTLAGLGLGAIPTVNTLVAQWAVPRRLLGSAMGAIFFSITMGMAISPAVLGSVMNASYATSLEASAPAGLHQFADEATVKTLGDPRALLSPTAMKGLKETFSSAGGSGPELFRQTVEAIRVSIMAGLRSVFLLGSVTMVIAFLLILTVPEVSMDAVVQDKKAPQPAAAKEAAV
jgi:MFS family permease